MSFSSGVSTQVYSCKNIDDLPFEVYGNILSFLSFPEITAMQGISKTHHKYEPLRYLKAQSSHFEEFLKVIFRIKTTLPEVWKNSFIEVAKTCKYLDLSEISVNNKNIILFTEKLKKILPFFASLEKINLCNPYINAQIVRECSFSKNLKEVELYFDPAYLDKGNLFKRIARYCYNLMGSNSSSVIAEKFPTSCLKSFSWKHNGLLPHFDYSEMGELVELKLCAHSIEEAPLTAHESLKFLTIKTLKTSSLDGLQKLELERFSSLEVLRYKNLLFTENNLCTLLSLRKLRPSLVLDIIFTLSDSSVIGLEEYCNALVELGGGGNDSYAFILQNSQSTLEENESFGNFLEKLSEQFTQKINLLHLQKRVTREIHYSVQKWHLQTLILEKHLNVMSYELISYLGNNLVSLSVSLKEYNHKLFLYTCDDLVCLKDLALSEFLGNPLDVEFILMRLPSLSSLTLVNLNPTFLPFELKELPFINSLTITYLQENLKLENEALEVPEFKLIYKRISKKMNTYSWKRYLTLNFTDQQY